MEPGEVGEGGKVRPRRPREGKGEAEEGEAKEGRWSEVAPGLVNFAPRQNPG